LGNFLRGDGQYGSAQSLPQLIHAVFPVSDVRDETQGSRPAIPGNDPGINLQPFDRALRRYNPKRIIVFRRLPFQSHQVAIKDD